MALSYFKRYRMEIDLTRKNVGRAVLPSGYVWVPWHPSLIDLHAEVKYRCFCAELDARVFPCLGENAGCHRLMREIAGKEGFTPEATWLVACPTSHPGRYQYCGTIQGVLDKALVGTVQNLGVVPDHRGNGLGRALLLKALQGFQSAGARRSSLEVTADNAEALRLYRSVGFRKQRTVYKAVEVEPVPVASQRSG
jgi:ribosomal protein S18 acetylase RimI-like enzyme